jgi:hypothetical protein
MVRRALSVCLFLCLIVSPPAVAGEAQDDLMEWMRRQEDVQRIEGRFLQHRKTPLLAEPLISAGTFRLERPDRIRWMVENPEAMVLEMDGDQIRGGRPGKLRELPLVEGMAGLREMTGLFFGGSRVAMDRFRVKAGPTENSFVLTPREGRAGHGLAHLEMVLDGPQGGLSEIVLASGSGDLSTIRFLDVVVQRMAREKLR